MVGMWRRAVGRDPVLIVAVATFAAIAEAQPDTARLAGTYEVALCKAGPCSLDDTTRTLSRGFLVLFAGEMPRVTGAAGAALTGWYLRSPPNGCLSMTVPPPRSETFAAGGVRSTFWDMNPGGDSVRFSLYRSPDAGHEVIAGIRNGELTGGGRSWGVGVVNVRYPRDTIVGRRIGPPDIEPCLNPYRGRRPAAAPPPPKYPERSR